MRTVYDDRVTSTEGPPAGAQTGRKEPPMDYQISPPRPVGPSGPGALSGHEARCSCGLVMRSSLETILFCDIMEHGFWHQAKTKGGVR